MSRCWTRLYYFSSQTTAIRSQNTVVLAQFSTVRNLRFAAGGQGKHRRRLAMDPNSAAAAPYPNAAEDFVHIENPLAQSVSLSDSIVNVELPTERDDDVSATAAADRAEEDDSDSGSGSGSGSGRRKVLPEELSRSVAVLTCESSAEGGVCDVHLVGTAHVSMESCREVEAVIRYLEPEVVFLELCASRVAVLSPQNLKVPTAKEMIDMWKKNHNAFGILYSWFLAKVASKLEVYPGTEFRVAYEEALKYGGKVILGDRPVQITLRRTWVKLPLWHKIKLIFSILFQAAFLPDAEELDKMLKEMDDVDMLTLVIQEMSKEFPTLMETLLHERDQYMSSQLLKIASEHKSVVAVVGKGHLQGIKKHWEQPVVVKDLIAMPPLQTGISVAKVLKTFGVAVGGAAIISGIYLASKK